MAKEYADDGTITSEHAIMGFLAGAKAMSGDNEELRAINKHQANEWEYWKKRCEAAEAVLHKHYKEISDSPTYMEWQQTINR